MAAVPTTRRQRQLALASCYQNFSSAEAQVRIRSVPTRTREAADETLQYRPNPINALETLWKVAGRGEVNGARLGSLGSQEQAERQGDAGSSPRELPDRMST
jgi:hypothetical protein